MIKFAILSLFISVAYAANTCYRFKLCNRQEFLDIRKFDLQAPLTKVLRELKGDLNKLKQVLRNNGNADLSDIKRTCEDYYESGMKSGKYMINPAPGRLVPFQVECKVDNKRVYTVLHHDSEAEQRAKDCEPKRCSIKTVTYNLPLIKIRAVVEASTHCRQFIKYRCEGSVMNWKGVPYFSWNSHDGIPQFNWGGGKFPSECACGATRTCSKSHYKCNCDSNKSGVDEGYLTDSKTLPVTNMRFGDLGSSSEKGWHTLGPLECWSSY